jgi:hypothetical protein
MRPMTNVFTSLIAAVLLLACGGGGGGSSPSSTALSQTPPPALHTAILQRLDTDSHYSLWRVNEDGSGFTRLTDPAVDAQYLALSGDRIVYKAASGQLWSLKVDGSDNKIISNGTFDLMYRGLIGSKVIFSSRTALLDSNTYTLFSVNADGTGLIELGTPGFKKLFQAIAANRIFYQEAQGTGEVDVFVVNPDGSSGLNLTLSASGTNHFGCVDGSKLYYVQETTGARAGGIYSHNLDGTGSDLYIAPQANYLSLWGVLNGRLIASYQDGSGYTNVSSSPIDGSGSGIDLYTDSGLNYEFKGFMGGKVIVQRPFSVSAPNDIDIWSCDANGANKLPVASSAFVEKVEGAAGNQLVYRNSSPGGGTEVDLLIVNVDGTGRTNLAVNPDTNRFLTANGSQLFYVRQSSTGVNHLWSVNADGTSNAAMTSTSDTEILFRFELGKIWYTRAVLGASTGRAYTMGLTPGSAQIPLSDGAGFDQVVATF